MLKTIKQLWPFWIYVGINIFIFLPAYFLSEDWSYFFLFVVYLPEVFICPFIFGPIISFLILKKNSISIKKLILLSALIFICLIFMFSIPYISEFINLGLYNYFANYYSHVDLLYSLAPALVFTLLFFITSLILYVKQNNKKEKRAK